MLRAINLLVLQEAAVALASAHEVVVAGARGEAAADGRSRLLTLLAVLHNGAWEAVRYRPADNREGRGGATRLKRI